MERSRVVLLVNADDVAVDQLHGWLADDGNIVLRCSGPHAPTYTCRGWDEQGCLLVDACDVVVLDLRLDSDPMMEGPASWQLLFLYRSQGKPVVALGDPDDAVEIIRDPQVVVLPRHPDRRALVSAVRSLMGMGGHDLPANASGVSTRSSAVRAAQPCRRPTKPTAVADVADIWL